MKTTGILLNITNSENMKENLGIDETRSSRKVAWDLTNEIITRSRLLNKKIKMPKRKRKNGTYKRRVSFLTEQQITVRASERKIRRERKNKIQILTQPLLQRREAESWKRKIALEREMSKRLGFVRAPLSCQGQGRND